MLGGGQSSDDLKIRVPVDKIKMKDREIAKQAAIIAGRIASIHYDFFDGIEFGAEPSGYEYRLAIRWSGLVGTDSSVLEDIIGDATFVKKRTFVPKFRQGMPKTAENAISILCLHLDERLVAAGPSSKKRRRE